MSSLVAKKILHVMENLTLIPIDDAFLGICLELLHIKPTHHNGFKSWGFKTKYNISQVCAYKDLMTLHKLTDEALENAWQFLIDSESNVNCSKIYRHSHRQSNKTTLISDETPFA